MPAPHPPAAQPHAESTRAGARYRLIAYLRLDPEDDEPLTYEEALSEKDQQEMMSPENIYCIEEMPLP